MSDTKESAKSTRRSARSDEQLPDNLKQQMEQMEGEKQYDINDFDTKFDAWNNKINRQ